MNIRWIKISAVSTLAILAVGFLVGCSPVDNQANGTSESNKVSKTIKLTSAPSGHYEPKEIRVKVGTKVRIEGDPTTLTGGMDTLVIEGYGINKKISQADYAVEFVADKSGTFKMRFANYMGNGELIVD